MRERLPYLLASLQHVPASHNSLCEIMSPNAFNQLISLSLIWSPKTPGLRKKTSQNMQGSICVFRFTVDAHYKSLASTNKTRCSCWGCHGCCCCCSLCWGCHGHVVFVFSFFCHPFHPPADTVGESFGRSPRSTSSDRRMRRMRRTLIPPRPRWRRLVLEAGVWEGAILADEKTEGNWDNTFPKYWILTLFCSSMMSTKLDTLSRLSMAKENHHTVVFLRKPSLNWKGHTVNSFLSSISATSTDRGAWGRTHPSSPRSIRSASISRPTTPRDSRPSAAFGR